MYITGRGFRMRRGWLGVLAGFGGLICTTASLAASTAPAAGTAAFPLPLDSYSTAADAGLFSVLADRVRQEPMNLVASIIFLLAIIHTFMAPLCLRLAHKFRDQHRQKLAVTGPEGTRNEVSFKAEVFHFLGEVEAVFGIWVVPLLAVLALAKGWPVARDYLGIDREFREPLFVVVIMTIAASRPVLEFAEKLMALFAGIGKGSPAAWWLSIMTIGPILGSFITEPAAMTISALLLGKRFYSRAPSARFAYATLGLLFVNISVGGTLTHFAAPPVLMVASTWNWGLSHMLLNFGWKAIVGIMVANTAYFLFLRRELKSLGPVGALVPEQGGSDGEASAGTIPSSDRGPAAAPAVPVWITTVHILFLGWTVLNNHFPALFLGGFLFYLAFTQATEHHQSELALRPALLVGFFLAGLVVHGGLQGWWIEPLLTRLSELPLFFGAVGLTAFNDNAAITYLASLVPGFSPEMKYAVVAGAVVGGGLTVIANAPNPAGQSILSKYFPDGVSPVRLFLGALIPTAIMAAVFLLARG